MAKRIPPSAEQIEQALTDQLMRLPAEFAPRATLPMIEAQRVIAKAFNTSHTKARDWLFDIAASSSHPVEVLRCSALGTVSSVLRLNSETGRMRWQSLAPEYGHSFLTSSPRLQMLWGRAGVAEPADAKHFAGADRPADEAEFVAVTKYFEPIIQEYADHYLGEKVTREGELILQTATVEHHHGEGLAYIRGLLDAVTMRSLEDQDDLLRIRMGKEARLKFELVGDEIDRLGEALKSLGVQPKREDN